MIVYVNDLQMVGTYRCPSNDTHTHTHTKHTHKTKRTHTHAHTLCIIAVLALRWNLCTNINCFVFVLAEFLHCYGESTLVDLVQLLFSQLPLFSEDDSDSEDTSPIDQVSTVGKGNTVGKG